MKLKILLFVLVSSSLFAMEDPRKGKRPAQESTQELQAESKTQRAEPAQDIIDPNTILPVPGLPDEILLLIQSKLIESPAPKELLALIESKGIEAPGDSPEAQLILAGNSTRSFFMSYKQFSPLLNDVNFAGQIINVLAQRYADGNVVLAARALGTNAASQWLAEQLQEKLGIDEDGSTIAVSSVIVPSPEKQELEMNLQEMLGKAFTDNRTDNVRFLLTHLPALANRNMYLKITNVQGEVEEKQLPPLQVAIYLKKSEIVRLLLKFGAKITDEMVALSVEYDSPEILAMLINAGADIYKKYEYTDTDSNTHPHSLFFWANTKDMVRYLVLNGLDMNEQDSNNANTPLIDAVYNQNEKVVDELLKLGAYPNIQNDQGETALHIIASAEPSDINLTILKDLLDNGAALEIKDNHDDTPLGAAIRAKNFPAAQILLQRGARLPERMNRYLESGETTSISPLVYMIFEEKNVNQMITQNFMQLLGLLIAHGVNVNELVADPDNGENKITLLAYLQKIRQSPFNTLIMKILTSYGAHE
ncbi:hypothetical protein BH09DEP1_BH09DEP1_6560 [soil metagenome]